MIEISETVADLKPSGIREFFDLVMSMDDVISLGVGEPDFATPWHIREAAIQSIEDGYTNYTSNTGMPELRNAISEHMGSVHNLDYDPEDELLITTGVSEGMDLAMRALLNPGDEVIVPTPCYVSYLPTAKMAGGRVKTLNTAKNDFKIDPAQLDRLISAKTKLLVLNYPSNPTGVTYGKKELAKIAELVREHELIVISDEIYGHLTYNHDHYPFPTLEAMQEHTVFLNGYSKSCAMTGMRIAYAAGPEKIIGAMNKIHQYTMLCAPTTSQFAAVEATRHGADAIEDMKGEYERRRNLVHNRLNEMGLDCPLPEGAFYAFPSVQNTGLDPEEFCRKLLSEHSVAAVPGAAFGPGGETNIRISYATGFQQLREALSRMKEFVHEHTRHKSSSTSS